MREKLTEQGGALKRMSSKLTEMMNETTSCNDLQVTGLLNEKAEAFEAQLQSVRRRSLSTRNKIKGAHLVLKCGVVRPMDQRDMLLARPYRASG
ncbi:hypothetical protein HAX54_017960, partial [Datura stramonium]|nr:hypothetical protein [Datura stramonium]